jgi:hypothetical protein
MTTARTALSQFDTVQTFGMSSIRVRTVRCVGVRLPSGRARNPTKRRQSVEEIDSETESELISAVQGVLRGEGIADDRALAVARKVEGLSRDFFTIGNKRKNALGEGFEDLLFLLLKQVSRIPPDKVELRTPVSKLPGFRRAAPRQKGERQKREPRPDIAITEQNVTHVITTAKWSMRQDRETQFQSEYSSFQMNKVQSTELTYALITNEFDLARLKNVATATQHQNSKHNDLPS